MPSKRRPSSLLGPLTSRNDCGDNKSSLPFPTPSFLDPFRFRTQSLKSGIDDQVFVFSNSSKSTIGPPVPPHVKMTSIRHEEVPSYISSRSANSLISFSRPTRIQALTLHYLNKVLDELLLHVLTSAKSLATDRIKTDGILKVLGGQSGSGSGAGALLAKNAVLEAELELRNYLDDQRKEGGKVPLGLSATSRWDGTGSFPVQKAYEALRIRCQYYSTLGDLEDPSPHLPQDQNIMSSDGRPMATITPGVAIYVTALLEFVGEYVLQNVGRVIERDNSDEAGLTELLRAMEEDEGTAYWFSKLNTRNEMLTREEEEIKGGKGKVGKPWRVPEASEWNEAAGRKKFQRQSVGSSHTLPLGKGRSVTPNLGENRRTPSSMSLGGFESRDSSLNASQRGPSPLPLTPGTNQTEFISGPSSNTSADTHNLTRRPSSDKGWFGKRRGSVRASSDITSGSINAGMPLPRGTLTTPEANDTEDLTASDDFDSLMMSNQTMKVSLTPNRLRSIEVAVKEKESLDEVESEADGKRSSRRRPGTLSPLPFREGERSGLPSPSSTVQSRFSLHQESENGDSPAQAPRLASRQSSYNAARSGKAGTKGAAPPSAYKGGAMYAEPTSPNPSGEEQQGGISPLTRRRKDVPYITEGKVDVSEGKLRPRDAITQDSNMQAMVDMFNSTPPMPSEAFPSPNVDARESRMSQGAGSVTSNDNSSMGRKSALTTAGGKMRNLFGRGKASSNGSIGGMARGNSEDSIPKAHTLDRSVEVETSEPSQYRSRESSLSRTAGSGSGLNSLVAQDALTKGLLEGHEKALRASLPKPVRKIPVVDEEEATKQESTDTGPYRSSESALGDPISPRPTGTAQTASNASNSALTSPGLVYQDTKRNSSTSELSSSNNARPVPSRKVPWTYSRQSSGTDRRVSGSVATGGVARVGSGASSNTGHAPPSAWSHGQNNGDFNGNGLEVRAPTPSRQSNFSGGSPGSSNNKPSDTARILAQLNLKMKEANSADECRFLLTQALAAAAAAVHNDLEQNGTTELIRSSSALSSATPYTRRDSGSAFGEAVDEDPFTSSNRRDSELAPPLPEKDTRRMPLQQRESNQVVLKEDERPLPIKHRNLMLPMAVGYNINEDYESPIYKKQGQYVAWLLDGQETGSFDNASPAMFKSELYMPSHGQSSDELEKYSSADERTFDSPRPDQESLTVSGHQRESSSVASTYRDATSEDL